MENYMRPLNYMEIRTLVRSGAIGIDLNIDAFKHPLYSRLSIVEIDFSLKERAFQDCFNKVSDLSFNPMYRDELNTKLDIKVHVITQPKVDYVPVRGVTGFQLYWSRFLNYLAHRPRIKIKPSTSVVVPLIVNFIEGREIPKMSWVLEKNLVQQGLTCTQVIPAGKDNGSNTTVLLYNSSAKPIYIDDLSYLGDLRLLSN